MRVNYLLLLKLVRSIAQNKVILEALNFSDLRPIHDDSLQYKLAVEYTRITVLSVWFLKRSRKTLFFSFTTKESIKVHFGFVTC